jgi:hypothetical protein
MKCNVCGGEQIRCYQLREVLGHPGMMMKGEGMIFCICSPCLVKLVAAIKTDATVVETPEAVVVDNRVIDINNRSFERREMNKAPKPPKGPTP